MMASRWINVGSGCQQSETSTALWMTRETTNARVGNPAPISRILESLIIDSYHGNPSQALPLLEIIVADFPARFLMRICVQKYKYAANSVNNSEFFLGWRSNPHEHWRNE